MNAKHFLWAWVFLASCGSADTNPVASSSTQSRAQETSSTTSPQPPVVEEAPSTQVPRQESSRSPPPSWCNGACNTLLNEPFASWAEKVGQECAVDWQVFEDDKCEQWDYLRNCVYAAGGKVFRKDYIQEEYADFSWYSPSKNFSHDKLSSVAKANIKLTKARKASCQHANDRRPGEPVQELQADLDGDGKDEVIVVTTTRIFVDGEEFLHQLKPYAPQDVRVKILDIDTSDSYKELLVSNHYYEGNARRRVLTKYGAKVAMSGVVQWHDMEMKSDGAGRMRMLSGECGQMREEEYRVKKGVFQLVKKKVKGRYREEMCSACPYVYVWQQGRWQYQGEILRNLRSASLEGTHHLALGRHSAGLIRIRLGERKEETTFVDLFEVVARYDDGSEEVLQATECSSSAPAFCTQDRAYEQLKQGEDIDLSFRLPSSAQVLVRARGYYIPTNAEPLSE
ncbi:MAG: YARHG domain-containing protein [Kofleriaceae bacterium]|nr:YARHG domain-containing protein [Kofleriaceae bacterium]